MLDEFWKWLTTAGRPPLDEWRKPRSPAEGSTTQQLMSMGERMRDPDLLYSTPAQQRLYSPMYGDLSGSVPADEGPDYAKLASRYREGGGY